MPDICRMPDIFGHAFCLTRQEWHTYRPAFGTLWPNEVMFRRFSRKLWEAGNARTGRWLPGRHRDLALALHAAREVAETSPEVWHSELWDEPGAVQAALHAAREWDREWRT